ncbi:MAG: hypothetical protein HW380_622 [Magnetococcales bacterium]|nr:hypothetical protein [Magnetococcales bacterium]
MKHHTATVKIISGPGEGYPPQHRFEVRSLNILYIVLIIILAALALTLFFTAVIVLIFIVVLILSLSAILILIQRSRSPHREVTIQSPPDT